MLRNKKTWQTLRWYSVESKFKKNIIKENKRKSKDKYAHTVRLPSTQLAFFEKSSVYEHELLQQVDLEYSQQASTRKDAPVYTILDGPPYANGDLHIGHAINKILKDIFGRAHIRAGDCLNFRPGWDCHGQPIEQRALKTNEDFILKPEEVRKKAREFALQTLDKQRKSFRRWAIMADMNNPYITCSNDYVAKEIRAFGRLYEQGLIIRAHQPIYWSPSSHTALAESELEYNENHAGHSAWISFPMCNSLSNSFSLDEPVHALVWTTTPWTLVANEAISYGPQLRYCLVRHAKSGVLLLAQSSLENVRTQLQDALPVIGEVEGAVLETLTYEHPLRKGEFLPFLPSNFLVDGKGTGLVHTAPAHGYEDYLVFKASGRKVKECMVDKSGCYNEKVQQMLPKQAVGLSVLNEGSLYVLKEMTNNVVAYEPYIHSYPYDWRTKQPVLTLPMYQFFIDISPIQEECERAIDKTIFHPAAFSHKLKQNIVQRPHWCISRQRCWGVPIPTFYHIHDEQKANPIIHSELVDHIATVLQTKGIDAWWEADEQEFLNKPLLEKLNMPGIERDYVKGKDILDVWFDSGLAFHNVLNDKKADLIVEGQDQLRGWFLSSMILSVALTGQSPFSRIFVHGFAVDANFKKMSKSLGNVLNPTDLVDGENGRGADVLRLWVATYANSHINVATREEQFIKIHETLQKWRKTLRFCLANLSKTPLQLNEDKLCSTDRYFLHLALNTQRNVREAYATYDLRSVCEQINTFIQSLSLVYFASVKDTLYNDLETELSSITAQSTLAIIADTLIDCISPITPLLAQRILNYHPWRSKESVTLCPQTPSLEKWNCTKLSDQFSALLQMREQLHTAFNGEKVLLKLEAFLYTPDKQLNDLLSKMESSQRISELSSFLQTSLATVVPCHEKLDEIVQDNPDASILEIKQPPISILIRKPLNAKCKRCRKYVCISGEVCDRCSNVLKNLIN